MRPYKKVQREKTIQLLALGETVASISRKLKISPEIIYKWQKQPDFADALNIAKKQTDSEWAENLRSLIPLTTKALKKCLEGNATNAAGITKAIDLIWEQTGLKNKEIEKHESVIKVNFGQSEDKIA